MKIKSKKPVKSIDNRTQKLLWELPEDMRMDAHKWGMNDTPWRDSLWVWYERNKMGKVV